MKWISCLIFSVIFWGLNALASPAPQLAAYVVFQPSCAAHLQSTSMVHVHMLTAAQAASEFQAMLSLTHPFVVNYLQIRFATRFRPSMVVPLDLRLLAMIYGDSSDLDLRETGVSPFANLSELMPLWYFQTPSLRSEIAGRFLTAAADINWEFEQKPKSGSIELRNFHVQKAFAVNADRDGQLLSQPRTWETNDQEGITMELDSRIYFLRNRLKRDPAMRNLLASRLRWGLPSVTRTVRAYLIAYRSFINSNPNPYELVRETFQYQRPPFWDAWLMGR